MALNMCTEFCNFIYMFAFWGFCRVKKMYFGYINPDNCDSVGILQLVGLNSVEFSWLHYLKVLICFVTTFGLYLWLNMHCFYKYVVCFTYFHLLVSRFHFMLDCKLLRCQYLPWFHKISYLICIYLQIIEKNIAGGFYFSGPANCRLYNLKKIFKLPSP